MRTALAALAILIATTTTATAGNAPYRLEIYENGPRWQTVMIAIEFNDSASCVRAMQAIWARARMVVKTYDTKETVNVVDAACVPNKGDF